MYDTFQEKEQYSILMDKLKLQNVEYMQMEDQYVQKAIQAEKMKYAVLHMDIGMVKRHLELKIQTAQIKKLKHKTKRRDKEEVCNILPNYFSKDKIAVYTVMFGGYDTIKEPIVVPDNADFYLITDNASVISHKSSWNVLNMDKFKRYTEKMDAPIRNRWYKTHPHVLFPDYKYSLYVDSSIKIITDVTEHINKIGKIGMAVHRHPDRDCVYDELDIVKIYKRDSKKNFEKIEELYRNTNFPKHYGLLENTVIAYMHNEKRVIRIVENWWRYIEKCCRRDQLSLPVVLYNNGVDVNAVCGLGDNLKENYAFRLEGHLGHYGRVQNKERRTI